MTQGSPLQWLAAGILAVTALAVAFVSVVLILRGQPIPGYVISAASLLIGFAIHALGVRSGGDLSNASQTPPKA